ncbi:sterol 24-c-methyltransferase [Aspergillus heteromorphus CBS 117.55]|uniref:Sterol 24-C-methyltransferase n=1 Tax=Aspergillus heteromorphus CBS 117.55 TaxID=1448321 RepID=A0A317VMB4_9EURO|nr:sterol 24-c-methyltransferase [Aspergillus heteromorphus CBS 117.55]PWY75496.1 sterol 24-c-methyltransferase [Aspergillus heteromorphus CBS 117.55]
MAPAALEQENHIRDAEFNRALHGQSAEAKGGFAAMRGKDAAAQKAAIDEYFKHWDNKSSEQETDEIRAARRAEYATLTRHYYNIATDFYENAWGTSFHFCRFAPGEPFHQAIARHEHYLAHQIGIKNGMRVLDVGCGVGGPAREIVKFSDANVVGLNNNDYQIQRATLYAEKEGLSDKLSFVKGDFMQMQFPDNSFDAVYAIEATCHAPELQGVYSEIFRVLKPGGVFGVYEWLMTDDYDNENPEHRRLRLGIEQGDGISNMVNVSEGLAAMRGAGFELLHNEDLAQRPDSIPWYYPIAGSFKHMASVWDFFTIARMTWWGRGLAHRFVGAMEKIGFFPQGSQKTADSLALAADCLVAGAEKNLFTPMYLMVGRKPE